MNISSGHGTSLNELIAQLTSLLGRKVNVTYRPGRGFDVPVNVLANKLACTELNWAPKIGMNEGLNRTVAWLRRALLTG